MDGPRVKAFDSAEQPKRPEVQTFFDMKLPITRELRKMVSAYHTLQGDKSARIVRVVRDDVGYPALLVRVKDRNGEWHSCIDSDAGGYISEITSCSRREEDLLVAGFASGVGYFGDSPSDWEGLES